MVDGPEQEVCGHAARPRGAADVEPERPALRVPPGLAARPPRDDADVVRAVEANADALSAPGTPAFFVNGRPLVGAQPFEAFAQVIDDELARQGPATPGAPSK